MTDTMLLYVIGAIDAGLCASLVTGFFFTKRQPKLQIANLSVAFEFLEKRMFLAFPDLREGFTWREAIMKLRPLYSHFDWNEIDDVLKKYQDFRYGGEDPGNVKIDSIVKLALTLPRSAKK